MTRAGVVLAVFLALSGAAAAQVQPAPSGAPAVQDRVIRLSARAPASTYGYDPGNPIMLGGMAEHDFDKRVETYFGLLFSPEGEPLEVVLNETCCQHKDPASAKTSSLQLIEAAANGKRPYRFYVDGFGSGPLHIPRGLIGAGSAANAEIIQGALDNLRAGFADGAAQALRPLAEAGDVMAQYRLGRIAADARDYPAAYRWFLMAARNGHSVSQAAVAAMLEEGKGVTADRKAAESWRRQAAANGHAGSLMTLALAGLSGNPDAAALTRAAGMLRLAADLGDAAAQAAYGAMLVQGRGVPRDVFQGLVWLSMAKQGGDRNASAAYAQLAAGQTGQTMARVEQTADQWAKRRLPPPVIAGVR